MSIDITNAQDAPTTPAEQERIKLSVARVFERWLANRNRSTAEVSRSGGTPAQGQLEQRETAA